MYTYLRPKSAGNSLCCHQSALTRSVNVLWGLLVDEATTPQTILDLTEVHFINLEIQFTYVVLAMTLEPRLVTDVDHL
jgi:hypothetical protein